VDLHKVSDSGRSPIYLNCVRKLIEADRRYTKYSKAGLIVAHFDLC